MGHALKKERRLEENPAEIRQQALLSCVHAGLLLSLQCVISVFVGWFGTDATRRLAAPVSRVRAGGLRCTTGTLPVVYAT